MHLPLQKLLSGAFVCLSSFYCMKSYLIHPVGRSIHSDWLPPASKGWGKVIFWVSTHLQGVPHQVPMGGGVPLSSLTGWYPHPVPTGGGIPILFWWGVPHHSQWGYPPSSPDWDYQHPDLIREGTSSGQWGGGYPGVPAFMQEDFLVTAHICSMREGDIYTWKCLSVHFCRGGTWSQ